MSMQQIVIAQLAGEMLLYMALTLLVPYFVMGKLVKDKYGLILRLFTYFTVANAYIISLTCILSFLGLHYHIAYWFFTLAPLTAIYIKINNLKFEIKINKPKDPIKFTFYTVFTLALVVFIMVRFGSSYIAFWGLKSQEMLSHTAQVNGMVSGQLFSEGVRPYGLANLQMFFYMMFGIDPYTSSRVFGLTIAVLVALSLTGFLTTLCKSRFTPYLAGIFFFIWGIWNEQVKDAFINTKPVSFGMIFFPVALTFFLDFVRKQKEITGVKGHIFRRDGTKGSLVMFSLSMALCISAHYATGAMLWYCLVTLVIGFLGEIKKPRFFVPLLMSALLALGIAVLPMKIGVWQQHKLDPYIQTMKDLKAEYELENAELDYSMFEETEGEETEEDEWADDSEEYFATDEYEDEEEETEYDPSMEMFLKEYTDYLDVTYYSPLEIITNIIDAIPEIKDDYLDAVTYPIGDEIVSLDYFDLGIVEYLPNIVIILLLALLILGLICRLGDKVYAKFLFSYGLFGIYMLALVAKYELGINSIITENEVLLLLPYIFSIAAALVLDAFLSVTLGWVANRTHLPLDIAGGIVALGMFITLNVSGTIRFTEVATALQSNGNITCVNDMIGTNKNMTYTVISTGDEKIMVGNHGYCYNSLNFLKSMEVMTDETEVVIPTDRVYFYIEKANVISEDGEFDITPISETDADEDLPLVKDGTYTSEEIRTIVNSRMYFWAQAFINANPESLRIFYEDEIFVCFYVNQLQEHPYNFAVDYGYNSDMAYFDDVPDEDYTDYVPDGYSDFINDGENVDTTDGEDLDESDEYPEGPDYSGGPVSDATSDESSDEESDENSDDTSSDDINTVDTTDTEDDDNDNASGSGSDGTTGSGSSGGSTTGGTTGSNAGGTAGGTTGGNTSPDYGGDERHREKSTDEFGKEVSQ